MSCPASAIGTWVSREVGVSGDANNVFRLVVVSASRDENPGGGAGVMLDSSGCHQCSFSSAAGHQTTTGVALTLRFTRPSAEVDAMTGTLRNGSCSRRRDCRSAAPHSRISKCFSVDGEGVSAK